MREINEYNFEDFYERGLCSLAAVAVDEVREINRRASENGFLDSQWLIDFHDDLNEQSIDEDREDTKTSERQDTSI